MKNSVSTPVANCGVETPLAGLAPTSLDQQQEDSMEFLVEFEVEVPAGTPDAQVEQRQRAESAAAAKLAEDGHLIRLWRRPLLGDGTTAIGKEVAHNENNPNRKTIKRLSRGFEEVRQLGLGGSFGAAILLANANEGLIGRGRTAEAAALIDPHTSGAIDRDSLVLHQNRAEIDLLRGEVDAAAQRLRQIQTGPSSEYAGDFEQDVADLALWTGRPQEALDAIQRALERREDTEWVIYSGWLLAVGMLACTDLAERARARRDERAVRAALAATDDLGSWVKRERDLPFTDHPAAIPAARATWDAEHGRAVGANGPPRGASLRNGGSPWITGTAPHTPAGGRPKRC